MTDVEAQNQADNRNKQVWQTAAEGTQLVFIEAGDDIDMDDEYA